MKHFIQKTEKHQKKNLGKRMKNKHSLRGGVPNRPAGLQKEPAGIRLGRREKKNQRLWLTPRQIPIPSQRIAI
jgi:hypothetical protein